ncbi:MAG: MFS transporter [Gaiellaceae bacterium]
MRFVISSQGKPPLPRALLALTVAQAFSVSGSVLTVVALPWFVLTTTGSATQMGIVLAAEFGAMGLAGIPGGALASRFGARRTVLLADLLRAPVVGAIPILHWMDMLSFPVLLALVAVAGVFYAPYVASQQAMVPDIVGEDEELVMRGNAVLIVGERSAALAGPPLAGVLIAWLGAPVVLLFDAVSFLAAFAIVVAFLPSTVGRLTAPAARALVSGVRALFRDRLLGPWTISVGGFEAAWQMLVASLPVLAFVRYDGDPKVVGIALGGLGLGAVTGNLLAIKLLGRVKPARLAMVAKVLQVFAFWVLVVDLPRFGLAGVLMATGLMSGLVTAPVTAIRTMRMPADLRAATGAAFLTTMILMGAIGLAFIGPLLDSWGAERALLVAAIIQTVFTALFVLAGARHSSLAEVPAQLRRAAARQSPGLRSGRRLRT